MKICVQFLFFQKLKNDKWQMKIYVQFLFFSEHRKMKKEKLSQILIFTEKWKMFFHTSFYSLFSFSWEKNNVIFLNCNRNTQPNKIEADDSNCTVIYFIFISGLVHFRYESKNENWPQIFIFHFSDKIKIWHRFSFFIFLCTEKNKNWT